ncbi:hypothetical protein [Microscilla marina]|uniref:Uncharacterized protein n=1 Tax=Microscilla marina ATCC 23134 TaxID=313606 RepID=A1ZV08_MICM2|nr:hypothetical protein [Microscilla marina]EAY25786.1 hypothetical protein M23134_03360 [Microscilla marina ATCC 23134]
MDKILFSLLLLIVCVPSLYAQGLVPPHDVKAAYWYGITVILGLFTMIGLIISLTNLYSHKAWLHKTALGFTGLNALLGLSGVAVYIIYPAIGWVAFLPLITAITGAGLVWAKQKEASKD